MKPEPTLEQIRETISRLDDSSILSVLPLMRKMALMLGKGTASIMVVELCREGVKRGILE